jgi:hypothetical protein
MSEQPNQIETNPTDAASSDYKVNNVIALTQLVGTIVDYYSFKNRLMDDDDEANKWKKQTADENPIIPTKLDTLIEKSFSAQLKKFAD